MKVASTVAVVAGVLLVVALSWLSGSSRTAVYEVSLWLGGITALVALTVRIETVDRVPSKEQIIVPPLLARIERTVSLSMASASEADRRLYPLLWNQIRELVVDGADGDASPEYARTLVGDETWALVRPDKEPCSDPRKPGPDEATVEMVVASIERAVGQ